MQAELINNIKTIKMKNIRNLFASLTVLIFVGCGGCDNTSFAPNSPGITEEDYITEMNLLRQEIQYQNKLSELYETEFEEMNAEEMKNYLINEDEQFVNSLSSNELCKLLLDLKKKAKCKPNKRKYVKNIMRKVDLGGFKWEDKNVVFPGWAKFKEETNRLNVLIALYYEAQIRFCESRKECKAIEFIVECNDIKGLESGDIIKDKYKFCTDIWKKYLEEDLVASLIKIGGTLDQFKDGDIDAEKVKAVMNAEIKKLEETKEEKEEEEKEKTEGEETEGEETEGEE